MILNIKTQEQFNEIMKSDDADNICSCPRCGRVYLIDWTPDDIDGMIERDEKRLLIQDVLPNRTPYERELIRYAWDGSPIIACCDDCMNENY